MRQPAADLHLHTTASDGRLTIDTLPEAAAAAGIEWVAVTDHDRIHPELSAPVTTHEGISIIRGIELKVEADSQRIDLLGYAVERTDALVSELERLQQDRIDRGREIIDCVESHLDVSLDIEPTDGIGRPHIARAVAASEAPYNYQTAFDELIGDGCPCYMPRAVTPVDRGIELLAAACSVVGVAHPLRYQQPADALDAAAEVDAVERYYPYDRTVDQTPVDRAIETHGLLAIGGSDAHGMNVGTAGPPPEAFEAFRRHLSEAVR